MKILILTILVLSALATATRPASASLPQSTVLISRLNQSNGPNAINPVAIHTLEEVTGHRVKPHPKRVECFVTHPVAVDGQTQKEASQAKTTLHCEGAEFDVPKTVYTFTGCKSVMMEPGPELRPASEQHEGCLVGQVSACRRELKKRHNEKHGPLGKPLSFMNIPDIPECRNVEITNSLLQSE